MSDARRVADGGGARVRVLVVDDSEARRADLTAVLQSDEGIDVVAWAADGAGAVRTAARAHPDVIALDLRMSAMEGVAATQHIMRHVQTPILMTGSSGGAAEDGLAVDARNAGVVAIMARAAVLPGGAAQARELCRTVKRLAGSRPPRRGTDIQPGAPPGGPGRDGGGPAIVVIGASTGGPQALSIVLAGLPATFPAPVLVVQHIADGFLPGLVAWLRLTCPLTVAIAEAGQSLTAAGIYMAPPGRHLVVAGQRLDLVDDPPVSSHRPSVTVLFQSVARACAGAAVGVQLTGMGDDGAAGLLAMRQAGATTIAQDEATSVVFGMPAVAIALGGVELELPLQEIAPCVVRRIHSIIARRTP